MENLKGIEMAGKGFDFLGNLREMFGFECFQEKNVGSFLEPIC